MANSIYHLVPAADFRAQPESQPYLPPAFAADGFIHCTGDLELLRAVANRFYTGVEGEMWILVIDPDRVTAEVKWERPAHPDGTPPQPGDSPLFPHIYGPLNRDAITDMRVAIRAPDGTFLTL